MSKYDSIIWDWNGTLLNDVTLTVAVINDLFKEYGYGSVTIEQYVEMFRFPVRDYYKELGFDFEKHDFQIFCDKFCAIFKGGLKKVNLFADTKRVLSTLSTHQHFVLSAAESTVLKEMIRSFDIASRFEATYGLSDNLAQSKAVVGTVLLSNHSLNPEKTILIGDTVHDAEVAMELNLNCCLVSNGHNSHARLEKMNFPVFKSLTEVAGYLI